MCPAKLTRGPTQSTLVCLLNTNRAIVTHLLVLNQLLFRAFIINVFEKVLN